jgi:hypothetical protein
LEEIKKMAKLTGWVINGRMFTKAEFNNSVLKNSSGMTFNHYQKEFKRQNIGKGFNINSFGGGFRI